MQNFVQSVLNEYLKKMRYFKLQQCLITILSQMTRNKGNVHVDCNNLSLYVSNV